MVRRSVVLVALVACSSHGETPIPPDIREPEPPKPGPARLHVSVDGQPVVGATVLFEDFQHGVQTVQTDLSGFAIADIFSGAFVTAIDPFGPPSDGITEIRTFAGVAPFDSLELTGGTPPAATPIAITLTAPIEGTAATYTVTTSCGTGTLARAGGTGTPTGQLSLRGCNGRFDVLVETFDAGSVPRRSLYASNLTVGDGDTITIPGPYELIPQVEFQAIAKPGIAAMATKATRRSPNGMEISRIFDIPIDLGSGNGTFTIDLPNMIDGIQLTEARSTPAPSTIQQDGLLDVTSPSALVFLDLFSDPLPKIISAPTFSPPRAIVWGESAFKPFVFESAPPPQETADFAILDLEVTRAAKQWRWRVSSPHDGPIINLPTLTGDFAVLAIVPGDTVSIEGLSIYGVPGTYDSIRGRTLDTKNPAAFLESTFGRVAFEELR
ncbi:MAG: hypothetical protein ABI867_22975 [Kofleriaceae bacterium]